MYTNRPIYDDFEENPFEPIPEADYERLSPIQKRNYKLTRHYHIRSIRRRGDFWSKPPVFCDVTEDSILIE